MKICAYCGKENEDAASECVICHFTDFGTSQRTEPLAAAKAPTLRAEMREILSDWSKLFRALLIISTVSYFITWFHPYFVSGHLQYALAWQGYGAILTLPTSVYWLSMLLWIATAVGMWMFVKSARYLYTALLVFFVLLEFFSGVNVKTGFGSFFGAITNMSDGALLIIAYLSPVKEKFEDASAT
jgi:hypothetical protein